MDTTTWSSWVFNKTAKTVQLRKFSRSLQDIKLITNLNNGIVIYDPTQPATLGQSAWDDTTKTLTLIYNTASMSNTDTLEIIVDQGIKLTQSGNRAVGNATQKFRDGFNSGLDTSVWDLAVNGSPATLDANGNVLVSGVPKGDRIVLGGNAGGSSYINIIKSAKDTDEELTLTSKDTFTFPVRLGSFTSLSQRFLGQEYSVEVVGIDGNENIVSIAQPADIAITQFVVLSNVATITTATNHGLTGGTRISIYGASQSRLNVGPVVVTPVTATTFTVPVTMPDGTYAISANVRVCDPLGNASNAVSLLWENNTTTNASFVARRNGSAFRSVNNTVGSTAGTQATTAPYTDAWTATTENEIIAGFEEAFFVSRIADSLSTTAGSGKYSQSIPDENVSYKIRLRAKNLKGLSAPVAEILTASKSGTTTVTITTDVAHGLNVNDFVVIYGIRDTTNFPNLTAQTQVASVISATQFTIVMGSAATASSYGGFVMRVQGGTLPPGMYNYSIQSISRSNNILTVTGATSISNLSVGDWITLYGLYDGTTQYQSLEIAYKVLRVSSTIIELESNGADFATINLGGGIIRNTCYRIHGVRMLEHARLVVEMNNRGTADQTRAIPISSAASIPVIQSTGATTLATAWATAPLSGIITTDISSAAITSTQTSTGISKAIGAPALSFTQAIGTVSGTNPTLDTIIEDAIDGGSTWVEVYHFPRVTTGTQVINSALVKMAGGSFRYRRVVGGTTPSFTLSVSRANHATYDKAVRQWFDRAISPTTSNSTTAAFYTDGCTQLQVVYLQSAGSAAATITIEGSDESSTTGFYDLGIPLTTPASGAGNARVALNATLPKFVRGRVSTAGTGNVMTYMFFKCS